MDILERVKTTCGSVQTAAVPYATSASLMTAPSAKLSYVACAIMIQFDTWNGTDEYNGASEGTTAPAAGVVAPITVPSLFIPMCKN